MSAGSFDYQSQDSALAMAALQITVNLYNANPDGDDGPYTVLPNIRCEQIQYKEGIDPPTARFSYILDEIAAAQSGDPDDPEAATWPLQFENIWPLGTPPSNYVVGMGDELVVLATLPPPPDDSSPVLGPDPLNPGQSQTRVLFHGFARVPQADIAPDHQSVTFTAVGVAVRAWEVPISGRFERDNYDPQEGMLMNSDLPTRFNPAGTGTRAIGGILPNCTPKGYDVNQDSDNPYPIFLDPNIDRDPDPRTLWNLSGAARYILWSWNFQTDVNGDLVIDNPDFGALDNLLQNRRPLKGAEFYDPDDPSTYQTDPNNIRDYDASNKPWPEVLHTLLDYYNFGMRWVCEDGNANEPYDYLEVYRKDAAGPTDPKPLYLPSSGADLSTSQVNLSTFHAGFDFHNVANDIFIESHVERWEVSIILAPGFAPVKGDGAADKKTMFLWSNLMAGEVTPESAVLRAAYRNYVADECGDGFWDFASNQIISTKPFKFSPIFPNNQDGSPGYVRRYRPGKGTLFSKDLNNKPLKATLSISRDYGISAIGSQPFSGGPAAPCFWNSVSGTWQDVAPSTWSLMEDRLGIMITVEDVEQWHIGVPPKGMNPNGQPWPESSGIIHGISCISDPDTHAVPSPGGLFWLRLTTVIEADFGIGAEATRRDASPLKQSVQRRIDCTDHYHWDAIDGCSMYSTAPAPAGTQQQLVQDDTDESLSQASQIRSAHEFPPLVASAMIPMLDLSWQVGDRVGSINGRNINLCTNAGTEQQELPSFPFVVGVTYDFQGEAQHTTLQLSDRRTEGQSARA
jgi:hypothetical protein